MARPQQRQSDSVRRRKHNRTESKSDALMSVTYSAGKPVSHQNGIGHTRGIPFPPLAWKNHPGQGWEIVSLPQSD